jgi:hypothetical protein
MTEIRMSQDASYHECCRTGERKAVRETAFARGNVQLAAHFKLSQNYYVTVFSGLFSEFFVSSYLISVFEKKTLFNLTTNSSNDLARTVETYRHKNRQPVLHQPRMQLFLIAQANVSYYY